MNSSAVVLCEVPAGHGSCCCIAYRLTIQVIRGGQWRSLLGVTPTTAVVVSIIMPAVLKKQEREREKRDQMACIFFIIVRRMTLCTAVEYRVVYIMYISFDIV